MKKIIILIFVLISLNAIAQKNFTGKATYFSKTQVELNLEGRDIPEDRKKMIMERVKRISEKTFELTFNKSAAIYKEKEKLETPGQGNGGRFKMMMSSFSGGKQYKNTKTQELVEEKEFFGKNFLIKEKAEKLEWELTQETKQIGKYTCFKATAKKMIEPSAFNRFRRPRPKKSDDQIELTEEEKEKARKEAEKKREEESKPKEVTIVAWYTPQIPVSNGPKDYSGLPGLILELNEDKTTILCTEIVMNPDDIEDIKEPTKGKEVTREQYNTILKEKMVEMRERFRNGRGGGPGGRR